jgi:hypothetical protein
MFRAVSGDLSIVARPIATHGTHLGHRTVVMFISLASAGRTSSLATRTLRTHASAYAAENSRARQ